MLAQLLTRRGVAARAIPHAAASRDAVAQLHLADVAVVAVSCLDLNGVPAHLRYLIRRLRERAPHAALVAGLWDAGDPILTASEAQRALGPGRYVTSLRDAADAAVASLGAPSIASGA